MDASDLDGGFRLGDWVVEPNHGRITGNGETRPLLPHQARILEMLARRHGEVVDRQALRDHAWPSGQGTDDMLRVTMRELRLLLGDSPRDPRYLVKVAHRGYALVAHVEPLGAASAPERSSKSAPSERPTLQSTPEVAMVGGIPRFLSELRRRSVFKVLGAYLVAIWLVLQVAQTTFAPLHLPQWWMTALTILGVIGIPIVGILAWSYEITATGIVLDSGDTAKLAIPRARRAFAPWLVAGVAAMAGVTGFAWWRSIGHEGGSPEARAGVHEALPASVAVLPLVDMTPGGGNAYLGDGFAEEISAQLAQLPGLRVAARTSAFEFKDKAVDVRKIGEALGVRHVLEGSVRREGDKLRVTVQLIDAGNGYHVWAGSYDRDWADVIAIQDDISRSISRALELVLTPEAEQRLKRGEPANLAAYDAYLAGVSVLHKSGDLSQLKAAEDQFRQALSADPQFARAWAGLCQVGIRRYQRTNATTDVTMAEAACRKALELEPSRDESEMALASLYLASGRDEQAEAVYRGLVTRRPRDPDVLIGLGNALGGLGEKAEAEKAYRRAIELDPGYWGAHNALGGFMFVNGRAEEAVAAYRKAVELAPGSASVQGNLGAALLLATRLEEATAAFEKSLSLEPSRTAHMNLGTLYYYLGRYPDAVREYESAEAIASSDHQVVGAMADALWLIPGRRPDAIRLYERAARLVEETLAVNPTEAVAWAQLGHYSGRAGDAARAARAQAKAEALGSDDMYVHYFLALGAADRNDVDAARAHIERAAGLGYPLKLLDPGLKPLMPQKKA